MPYKPVTEADLDRMETYLQAKKGPRKLPEPVRGPQGNGHRERRNENKWKAAREKLVKAKEINFERVVHLEYQAWMHRTMGKSVRQIADLMQTTVAQVNEWLRDAMLQIKAKTAEFIELDREIELARTETLLEHYMPMALHDAVVIERIQQGEPIGIEDTEQPQKCAYLVMELIKLRAKLKGLVITQADLSALGASVDVIGWLRTHHEFIRDAAQAAPRDVLTLESDEPIDGQDHQNKSLTQGIPDAV
jgi:hypothetical protein